MFRFSVNENPFDLKSTPKKSAIEAATSAKVPLVPKFS